jgi:hypothetical protein
MNKASHKRKIKMARRMMSPDEIKAGVPVFDSFRWRVRKFGIIRRIQLQNAARAAKKSKA